MERPKNALLVPTLATVVAFAQWLKRSLVRRGLERWQQDRAFFELATDCIIVVDRTGTIRRANPQVRALFGYRPEELIGQTVEILVPALQRERHARFRADYARHPHGRAMGAGLDLCGLRKDGTEVPIDVALSPAILGQEGMVVIATIRDMTDRRALEEEQKLHARLSFTLSETLDLQTRLETTVDLLTESWADWSVIDLLEEDGTLRRAAVASHDRSQKELVERVRAHPPAPPQVEGILSSIRNREPVVVPRMNHRELERLLRDHPESLSLLREVGSNSYLVVPLIVRDRALGTLSLFSKTRAYGADDLKRLQPLVERISLCIDNARLHAETLRAVRSREDTIAIVSHDLKNPITTLKLSLQVLERTVRRGLELPDPRIDRLLRSMSHSVDQALGLITDLLEAGKIEAGMFTVEPHVEDPARIAAEVAESFRMKAEEAGVRLQTEIAPGLPSVWADRRRVEQVLENLLVNALKFTGRDGEVCVRVAPGLPGEVLFQVSDTGPGIEPAALKKIFDRYWQPERTRRQGTGLGLSIARGIVEAQGGRIWAESEPGRGSRFSFTVPMTPVRENLPESPRPAA